MRQLVAMIAIHAKHLKKHAESAIILRVNHTDLQLRLPLITLGAGDFDKINNLAINHLFASMFKIHCYICANNGLHLTRSPIGLVWMCNKIA